MCDVDAEFDALLNDDDMAEVDAMLAGDTTDASAADTTVKVNTKPAPVSQDAKQLPATASTKPALAGKKRQLLVPQQGRNKRVSVQMKSPSTASGGSVLTPTQPSSSPAAATAAPEPSAASSPTKNKPTPASEPAPADPESSAASSPTKTKPAPAAADTTATDAKTADNMEIDADKDDTDMAEAAPAADEEPEVQSPLKKAPKPETDDAGNPAAEPDKPSTAAASGGAPSTKALAAGKRKGLTVAKAATGPDTDPTPSAASKALADKPKPKPNVAAPKASTISSTGAATGAGSEAAGQKMPKAQTGFFFFCNDARPLLKDKEPGLSMPEYSKKLGEMWRELSDAEKQPYHDLATADKERVATENAAMDPSVKAAIEKAAADARAAKKQKKTGKAEKTEEVKEAAKEIKEAAKATAKEAKKSEKAAAKAEETAKKQAIRAAKAEAQKKDRAGFKIFHCNQFAAFKADNPGMEPAELSSMMAKAWEALDEAERDEHIKKAEEEAEAAAAQRAMKAKSAKSAKSAGKRSKKPMGSDAEDGDDSEQETEAAGGGGSSRRRAAAAEEEEEDSDREDVDWEDYPAAGIFSRGDGAFLVARQGVMLTEYGKVDTRKAKARLLHGGAGGSSEAELPVTTQEVEDFESSTKKFWTAVKSRMIQGALELEELEEGSPLEMCYLLGKLQEKGYELDPTAKRPKGDLDVVRRLPVMRLSMVVQRLLDMERRNSKATAEELARVKDALRGLVQAIKDKGDDGVREDDAAVVAAAALLESS